MKKKNLTYQEHQLGTLIPKSKLFNMWSEILRNTFFLNMTKLIWKTDGQTDGFRILRMAVFAWFRDKATDEWLKSENI